MNPQSNQSPTGLSVGNPAVNLFTRRTFMKTSALTVGAVALLSQGRALAVDGGDSSSDGMLLICIDEPANVSFDNAWPATWEGAIRSRNIYHETDAWGEGIVRFGFRAGREELRTIYSSRAGR
jgi:hypothetical protein